MIEIEGIKDFIVNNKESLEKMNQEMIASRGHVPLVWLTVDEAKEIAVTMFAYHKFCQKFLSGVNDNFLIKASKVNRILDKRIEQAEKCDRE